MLKTLTSLLYFAFFGKLCIRQINLNLPTRNNPTFLAKKVDDRPPFQSSLLIPPLNHTEFEQLKVNIAKNN